jgi:hypothetical protein
MKLCESCQSRIKWCDDFYCELTGKLIAIDDEDCVNHEKVQYDIQTRIELRATPCTDS